MNLELENKKMRQAFHRAGHTGKSCVFAVVDTAVNDVARLAGKVEYPAQFIIGPNDDASHGTWVAGNVIQWCPDSKVIAYNVFPNNKGRTALINAALEDVLTRARTNSRIQYFVNMSLACDFGSNSLSPAYQKMHSLIKKLNAARVPVVVAAGNSGDERLYVYPSRFYEPICVSALNNNGTPAKFTTNHDEVDCGSSGVNVVGLGADGGLATKSGTSMACPQVCGKAALLACKIKADTGMWPSEDALYKELISCAVDMNGAGYDKHSGYGFVDLRNSTGTYKALDKPQISLNIRDNILAGASLLCDMFRKYVRPAGAPVPYTRVLKFLTSGVDVKAVKDKLVELGYLRKSTHSTYGSETVTAVKKFQKAKQLTVDGMVGTQTWNALFGEDSDVNDGTGVPSDEQIRGWTRNLSYGVTGDDVKLVKDRLVSLGYLHASTHAKYGGDTRNAVKSFQIASNIAASGIVDQATWMALFSSVAKKVDTIDANDIEIPSHISADAARAIKADLAKVSPTRRKIVLEALRWCVDPAEHEEDLRSFYIRGHNLYNKQTLALNVLTESKLNAYLSNPAYDAYTSDGRAEMMHESALRRGFTQTGADCSGGIVGLMHFAGVVQKGFDANANTLYSRYCTPTTSPKPGDYLWRDGHVGIVAGGGYAVEWIGGAYGCQLSKIAKRQAFNYVDGRMHSFSAWTACGDPNLYA